MRKEYFNQNHEIFDLHLVMCGTEKCLPTFRVSPHIRPYYLIHYIIKGHGYYIENNNKHRLSPGDIFLIQPDKVVSYYNDEDDSFDFCWLSFVGSNANKYLEYVGLSEKNLVVHHVNTDFVKNVEYLVKQLESKNHPTEISLNQHILRCLKCVDNASLETSKKHSTISTFKNAVLFIESNYMYSIVAHDVVEYLKIDRSYLYRLFKKYANCSISQYISNYRINIAKDILQNNDISISQVAESVGMNDVFYFSKQFKQVTGMSPTQFKRQNKH